MYMAHAYVSSIFHIVFSPLNRGIIGNPELRKYLNKYMQGISHNLGCHVFASYVMPDHVHLLLGLPSKLSVAELVQKLKCNSSKEYNELPNRIWKLTCQNGYGAFSCSYSMKDKVVEYIRNQEEHHKKKSFEEEYQALLVKHNLG